MHDFHLNYIKWQYDRFQSLGLLGREPYFWLHESFQVLAHLKNLSSKTIGNVTPSLPHHKLGQPMATYAKDKSYAYAKHS